MEMKGFKGGFLVITAAVFWGLLGGMANFMKNYGISAYEIAFIRLFFGSLLLGIYLISRDPAAFKVSKKNLFMCVIMGFVSQGLFNIFYFNSIIKLGITAGVIMLYTAPAFTLVFSRIFLGTKLSRRRVGAIVVTFTGAVLTVSGGQKIGVTLDAAGIAAGVLSGATYGILPVFNKVVSSKARNNTVMFYSFITGALVVAPLANLRELSHIVTGDMKVFMMAVGLGLFPTIVSHFLFLEASKLIEAFKISILANFEVVVAVTLACTLYGDELGAVRVAGIILVISGTLIPSIGEKGSLLKVKKRRI